MAKIRANWWKTCSAGNPMPCFFYHLRTKKPSPPFAKPDSCFLRNPLTSIPKSQQVSSCGPWTAMYPTFNQFARWASQYRVIPMWMEPQLQARDFIGWVHGLHTQESNFFFLHSASSGPQARYSYIALDSPRYQVEGNGDTLTLRHRTAG